MTTETKYGRNPNIILAEDVVENIVKGALVSPHNNIQEFISGQYGLTHPFQPEKNIFGEALNSLSLVLGSAIPLSYAAHYALSESSSTVGSIYLAGTAAKLIRDISKDALTKKDLTNKNLSLEKEVRELLHEKQTQ